MNTFKKYCPNVYVAKCEEQYNKGEIIQVETRNGKDIDCEVYNLISEKDGVYYYSIVRLDEGYNQKKADKYSGSQANHKNKSDDYWERSNEGREFLVLAEPIKIGHHSEHRHRALIARNHARMNKSMEHLKLAERAQERADYWQSKADTITLANPESLEYFEYMLEQAQEKHKELKSGTIKREHAYSLTYANKEVKELKKKVEIAEILWK